MPENRDISAVRVWVYEKAWGYLFHFSLIKTGTGPLI
jgi:hypothetical protein